jgi:hypothetical protein
MGGLVAVVAALVMGGLSTPRAHVASRSMVVNAPLDVVWRTVRSVYAYAAWRPELRESELSVGDEGEEWRESTRTRSVRWGVTVDEPPHRFGARILDDDASATVEWMWMLEPAGNATRVTLTESGEVGNPIARFIRAHMTGHTKAVDAVLTSLAAKLGDAGAKIV